MTFHWWQTKPQTKTVVIRFEQDIYVPAFSAAAPVGVIGYQRGHCDKQQPRSSGRRPITVGRRHKKMWKKQTILCGLIKNLRECHYAPRNMHKLGRKGFPYEVATLPKNVYTENWVELSVNEAFFPLPFKRNVITWKYSPQSTDSRPWMCNEKAKIQRHANNIGEQLLANFSWTDQGNCMQPLEKTYPILIPSWPRVTILTHRPNDENAETVVIRWISALRCISHGAIPAQVFKTQ